jgi:hypothetical protein
MDGYCLDEFTFLHTLKLIARQAKKRG